MCLLVPLYLEAEIKFGLAALVDCEQERRLGKVPGNQEPEFNVLLIFL